MLVVAHKVPPDVFCFATPLYQGPYGQFLFTVVALDLKIRRLKRGSGCVWASRLSKSFAQRAVSIHFREHCVEKNCSKNRFDTKVLLLCRKELLQESFRHKSAVIVSKGYTPSFISTHKKGMPHWDIPSGTKQKRDLLFAFAVHPALVVVLTAIFLRGHAGRLLEDLNEVGLGGESQIICDGEGRLVQVS